MMIPGHDPVVFVDDLAFPELRAVDVHHLGRVLRLRAGDPIMVCDGLGRYVSASFSGEHADAVGPLVVLDRVRPDITVVFAPVKGERPEWAVGKLVELGVDRIVPLRSERSVVRWDADHDLSRLERIVIESSMQSRRAFLPRLERPVRFDQVAGSVSGPIAMADFDGSAVTLDHPTVLIGPEGGWAAGERETFPSVRLADTVLRAETAAVVAAAFLVGLRSKLVGG